MIRLKFLGWIGSRDLRRRCVRNPQRILSSGILVERTTLDFGSFEPCCWNNVAFFFFLTYGSVEQDRLLVLESGSLDTPDVGFLPDLFIFQH